MINLINQTENISIKQEPKIPNIENSDKYEMEFSEDSKILVENPLIRIATRKAENYSLKIRMNNTIENEETKLIATCVYNNAKDIKMWKEFTACTDIFWLTNWMSI